MSAVSSRETHQQLRFAISGPCGSGKSTLVDYLSSRITDVAVIREPDATSDIRTVEGPSTTSSEKFQMSTILFRRKQAAFNSRARIILSDRTFEEDREIFLPLYQRLGYLQQQQVDRISRSSIEAERFAGVFHGLIILTATQEVLTQRLLQSDHQRPPWLVKSIELQCDLYRVWIEKKRRTALIMDTTDIDAGVLRANAYAYIDGIVRSTDKS